MTTLLVSSCVASRHGAEIAALARAHGETIDLIALPQDPEARLPEDVCARVDIAFFSEDGFPRFSRQFFSAVRKAPSLKWLHVFNAGVDHPIYTEMLGRGVRLTTSSGTAAKPIAQNAIAGLLMLSRNFPRWLASQRARQWKPIRGDDVPKDLEGQTAIVVGLGHIGREIARVARALGLKVIGIKRSARAPEDPVDEVHAPEALLDLLPRADWLFVACPLTAETRGWIDAEALARLPAHAGLINIARGEIIDEAAMIVALREGCLAGAYLDVFQQEPLPTDSPLWDLPNVIITPHNAGAAAGNDRRIYEVFIENLARWWKREALLNEVKP